MKKFLILFIAVIGLSSCKNNDKQVDSEEVSAPETAYTSFGKNIDDDNVMTRQEMSEKFKMMAIGDTINTKLMATVEEVCQAKGCWMTLNLEGDEQVMVKFKDYGFFMPKDIAEKEVIVNGKAYVNEVPVDEQQHYAEDAGKSKEEIAAITMPKKTYSFEADGVLIKQ